MTNPYESPTADDTHTYDPAAPEHEMARRFTRFGAAFVDGILMMALVLPIQFFSGFTQRAMNQEVGLVEQLFMSVLGMAAYLLLNGYLLVTRGQSIGKALGKIQIVDEQTDKLLPFLRVYVYRYLWLMPFMIVIVIIPGAVDDMLVNILSLVNALFIFGAAQRCLHDYIAGSKVVPYKPGRARL